MEILLTPPVAFLIYIPLVLIIILIGKKMAGPEVRSELKNSIYASGEEASTNPSAPGYRPFFLTAFFFAVLHLGMLIIGSGSFNLQTVPFIVGIVIALVALLLG
jgi:NADH:ubiquinone oxidoreductase subunit 3 (subunit A)